MQITDTDFQSTLKQKAGEFLKAGKSVEEVQMWIDRQKSRYAEAHPNTTTPTSTEEAGPLGIEADRGSSGDFFPGWSRERDSLQSRWDRGLYNEKDKPLYERYKTTGQLPEPEEVGRVGLNEEQEDEHQQQELLRSEWIQQHNQEVQENIDNLGTWETIWKYGPLGLVSDKYVSLISNFKAGTSDILQGTMDFLTATGFSTDVAIRKLYDKDFAQQLEDDPELRHKLYEDMRWEWETWGEDYIPTFERTATEAALDGDWLEFGENIAYQTARATPSLLATSTGVGGMAVLGISAAGSSFTETIGEAPDSSLGSIYLTSLMKGGFEFASEYATAGILKRAGLLFKQGGKPAIDSYAKGIAKRVFVDFTSEGASEAGASLAGHITDYVVHGIEPPQDMWKQLADEFLVGGLLGGGVSIIGAQNRLPQHVIEARLETDAKIEADKADGDILNELINQAANAGTQEETDSINEQVNEVKDRIEQRQKAHAEIVADFTVNEAQSLLDLKGKNHKLKNTLKRNKKLTDEQKRLTEQKIEQNNAKINEIYGKVENYDQAVTEAAVKKAEIHKKKEEIAAKEKALAESENPNPSGTLKLEQQKKELAAEEKAVDDALHSFRPAASTRNTYAAIEKLSKKNEATHKDNLKILENENATKEEIEVEKARYKETQNNLKTAKEQIEAATTSKGEARQKAINELNDTLAKEGPTEDTKKKEKEASEEIEGKTPVAQAAVQLGDKTNSKVAAVTLAEKLSNTAVGVGNYLKTIANPRAANTAINNVIDAINAREDLTDAQKDKLVKELEAEKPTDTELQDTPTDKSFLDDSDVRTKDNEDHEKDVDNALNGGLQKNMEGRTSREDLAPSEADVEKDNIDRQKAWKTFDDFINRTFEFLNTWDNRVGPLKKAIKSLGARNIHFIISEGLVGNKEENFKFDNTPSTGVLTRIGLAVYEKLKAQGKDVSAFEQFPPNRTGGPNRLEVTLKKQGFTDEEIKRRAISYNALAAGGEMMQFVGGVDGFFEYDKGFPRIKIDEKTGKKINKRPQDATFEIVDLSVLEGTGIIEILEGLAQRKDILLSKTWKEKAGEPIRITIQDKLAFKEAMGELSDNGDGYAAWHELIADGTAIKYATIKNEKTGKESPIDSKGRDPYVMKLSAPVNKESDSTKRKAKNRELFNLYVRGATNHYLNERTSDKDALGRKPQEKKPSRWSGFYHESGLAAVTSIVPGLNKKLSKAFRALDTLSNASRVEFKVNGRALQMFGVLKDHLYTYAKDGESISADKRAEYEVIRDMADQYLVKNEDGSYKLDENGNPIAKSFWAMHRFDFRGRLYNAVKFLNFQNNKVAKAMYSFGKKKPIKRKGFVNLISQIGDYLSVDIVLNEDGSVDFWEEGKHTEAQKVSSKAMTKKDRFRIGLSLARKLADVAADPESHIDFLKMVQEKGDIEDVIALSTEMLNLAEHMDNGGAIEAYESNFILWNDATVSGAQNLAMLTGDPVTLSLVNGLDTYLKRDLYIKVGERVFGKINAEAEELGEWTPDDEVRWNEINEQLAEIMAHKDTLYLERDLAAQEERYKRILETEEYVKLATKWWSHPKRQAAKRKLAKGPVMTGFYSAGPWVMAEDMVKDFGNDPDFKGLDQGSAFFLTQQLKAATAEIAPGPKLAQSTFSRIAQLASQAGNRVELEGFINDFPFIQEYLYYKDLMKENGKREDAAINIPNPGGTSLRVGKGNRQHKYGRIQMQPRLGTHHISMQNTMISSAPNITHFLDGQIVASQFTNEASKQRDGATIHDNFGTHPSDATDQVQSVLDNMASMYEGNPMSRLIKQALGFDEALANEEIRRYNVKRENMTDEMGNLIPQADTNAITKNEYAISSAGGTVRYIWPGDGPQVGMQKSQEIYESRQEGTGGLLEGTQASSLPQTLPAGRTDIANAEAIIEKHKSEIENGGYVLVSLDGKTTTESQLLKIEESTGTEMKGIPGDTDTVAAVKGGKNILTKGEAKTLTGKIKKLLNASYIKKGSGKKGPGKLTIPQDVLDTIRETKKRWDAEGHLYTPEQVADLYHSLQDLVKEGKKTQSAWAKQRKEEKKETEEEVGGFIEETSDVKADTDLNNLETKSKKRRGVLERFKKARWLTATTNQDFYGLVLDLLPTGKFQEAQKWFQEKLFNYLEKGSYEHTELKQAVYDNFAALKDKFGVSTKLLKKETGIMVGDMNLTNTEVVTIYNYIKSPSLYKKILNKDSGINIDTLNEIIDHVQKDSTLRGYADGLPEIFASSKSYIQNKLHKHGRKGFQTKTMKVPENAAEAALLERVYDSKIPPVEPYIPFTANQSKSDQAVSVEEALAKGNNGKFYSAITARLTQRGNTGSLRIEPFETSLKTYVDETLRSAAFLDFAFQAEAIFSAKNLKKMGAAYGKNWEASMRDSLERIVTGRRNTKKY